MVYRKLNLDYNPGTNAEVIKNLYKYSVNFILMYYGGKCIILHKHNIFI